MGQISPVFNTSPGSIARRVGAAVRERRLAKGWTRATLSSRSGVSVDVLKRLETSGNVGFDKVIRVAIALDDARSVLALFPTPAPTSIGELERRATFRVRRYGVRRDSGVSRARHDPPDSPAPDSKGGRR